MEQFYPLLLIAIVFALSFVWKKRLSPRMTAAVHLIVAGLAFLSMVAGPRGFYWAAPVIGTVFAVHGIWLLVRARRRPS